MREHVCISVRMVVEVSFDYDPSSSTPFTNIEVPLAEESYGIIGRDFYNEVLGVVLNAKTLEELQ